MKARKWILAKHFEGVPKDSDLELVEEDLPALKDGDVLFEAVYLSVDPYMRPYSAVLTTGATMMGQQLAKVAQSKNDKYKEGEHYLLHIGWRDKTVLNPDTIGPGRSGLPVVTPTFKTGTRSLSTALGALGMPGLSAYFGLLRCCEPKSGETLFVNSAAGIVGSVVGQIAKIKGCHVIGCAGTDDKCKWLKSELGFDYVFNYKTQDLNEELRKAAPKGIDCYFDNVGGDMSVDVIQQHMNRYGRICCCGALSSYNSVNAATGPHLFRTFVSKELKMQGFLFTSFQSECQAAAAELFNWVHEGKLKYREEIVNGFDNMRAAFYGMLKGSYSGKVIVKA